MFEVLLLWTMGGATEGVDTEVPARLDGADNGADDDAWLPGGELWTAEDGTWPAGDELGPAEDGGMTIDAEPGWDAAARELELVDRPGD